MATLNMACSDRVLKVQQAAHKARKAWEMLEDLHQSIEEKKETQDESLNGLTPDELIKVKTGFGDVDDAKTLGYLKEHNLRRSPYRDSSKNKWSVMRNISKGRKQKTNESMNSRLEEKVNKVHENWSEAIRGVDFLRKNEGIGGGNVPHEVRKSRSGGRKKKSKPGVDSDLKSKLKEAMKSDFQNQSI